MPFLALSRLGVSAFVAYGRKATALWVGAGVLSEAEVKALRTLDFEVSTFTEPVRTRAEVEDAIPTLQEHHPNEPVWIESEPESPNPRSADIGQAFLWGEFVVGVSYSHNQQVRLVSGPNAGMSGVLVSLVCLEPEPVYLLEGAVKQDLEVKQSWLTRADA
jgi:hypothetical protein